VEIWKNPCGSLTKGMARVEGGYTCYATSNVEETAGTNGINVYRFMAFKRRRVCGKTVLGLRVA